MTAADVLLQQRFGDRLLREAELAPYTTLRIGGPAEFLLEARTQEDLIAARRAAIELNIAFTFLAGCSNVLISDAGLKGLVAINKTDAIQWRGDFCVAVDGGYNLDRFVEDVSRRGWADLSFAAGIPGSVGGAIAGGAGAFGNLVHEFVIEARVLRRNGEVVTMTPAELGIEYRNSQARKRGDIILEALMGGFHQGDRDALFESIRAIKAQREEKHPGPSEPSAGSFFKNLPPEEEGGRRIPAGKYLDEAGAKGMSAGGARVFHKHANIIINAGGATAADVNALANQMADAVRERFGIELEREVLYLC